MIQKIHVRPSGARPTAGSDEYYPHHALSEHSCRARQDWFDVKEGEASIFRPENGSYKLVARVLMDEWSRIATAAK